MRLYRTSSLTVDSEPVATRAEHGSEAGMTLAEVVISIALSVILFMAIVNGYVLAGLREEWSGYSLAAQTLSYQMLEQSRSAVWDPTWTGFTNVNGRVDINGLSNAVNAVSWSLSGNTFTVALTNLLDVPWKGTNYVIATNYVTVTTVNETGVTANPVTLQMIRVDTVWPFLGWGNRMRRYYTNTSVTYVAPDNRSPQSMGINTTNF
jgi:hypothetical protein